MLCGGDVSQVHIGICMCLCIGSYSPSSPSDRRPRTVDWSPTLPSEYHTTCQLSLIWMNLIKTTCPGQSFCILFICFPLQGIIPAYPPYNPAYPPAGPAMIPPGQPPQWNNPPPGQYPPGPVAPMV